MNSLIYLIPLLPLLGFALNGLFNRLLPQMVSSIIACGSVGAAFVLSLVVFLGKLSDPTPTTCHILSWITVGDLDVSFSFLIDALSSLFLLIITGVGFLIHVYSAGYMSHDEGIRRFFTYLNLFVFFMLILVMGDSYLMMFVGWEGVGLCSYLLIGFWFKNIDYSKAAKKAFVINRIGDFGFLLGMFMLFSQFGSLSYENVLFNNPSLAGTSPYIITVATLLLFVGAMGKSAQIPLYTWLPDAMAGPTPVSALIHAATMVTAGIYMVVRSNVLFLMAPITLDVILYVGLATSLLGAIIALFQNDIKKVMAYSTVSQLGFMFVAIGSGAFTAAVFHVITHAFFKALLFLSAGSVIHAMGGEQDLRKMGGLKKVLPITFIVTLIGSIAISGIVPFAGFFSKDQILAEVLFQKGPFVFGGLMLISLMTAFYTFRLLFLAFFGSFRGTEEQKSHLHESPISMTLPMMVLAGFAIFAGFIGFPHALGESIGFHHFLDHYLESSVQLTNTHWALNQEILIMVGTSIPVLLVIAIAYTVYVSKKTIPVEDVKIIGFRKVAFNKFYVDEFYSAIITKPLKFISKTVQNYFDTLILDGFVNGSGKIVNLSAHGLSRLQSGNLGTYLLCMVIAIVVIIGVYLF